MSARRPTDTPLTMVITGANRGIGLALAEEAVKRGHIVWATARQPQQATLQQLKASCPDHLQLARLEITDAASISELAELLREKGIAVDVLINNAAVFPEEGDESFLEIDPAHFTTAFQVNVVGTLLVTRGLWASLLKASAPRVVNVSSGAGSISAKEDSAYLAYATSKAALNMLTRAMAAEARGAKVTVVALSPGWVRTDMGGPHAPLEPRESARSILDAVENLSLRETGQFLDRFGSPHDLNW
ncbi:MAG: SDR family oxidoreductase [Verrucomicrobiia bacterium]